MGTTRNARRDIGGSTRLASFFTQYADADDAETKVEETEATDAEDKAEDEDGDETEIVIPEDLSTLDDAEVANLHSTAVDAFTALYGEDGSGLDDNGFEALSVLTEGIERIGAEKEKRELAAAKRADDAKALAARAGVTLGGETGSDESGDETPTPDPEAGDETALAVEEPTTTVVEEAPKETPKSKDIRVNLSGLRSRQAATPAPATVTLQAEPGKPTSMKDIVFGGEDLTQYAGKGLDWTSLGDGLDRRLGSFNQSAYESAAQRGQHMRDQRSFAVVRKPLDEGLVITSANRNHIEEVLSRAVDQSRLEGQSLVAAGGWCPPSETIYDLLEVETRDGLFSLPEIGITRGGLNHTRGPDFSTIFALARGFHYTEEQDIDGTYGVDANGIGDGSEGDKPCFRIPCPEFEEDRLDFDGLCITAGLLQQKGYPEMIARTIRGALVAHDHRMAGRVLADIAGKSTAVSMAAGQVGATAPLLTAIELQVEHYRTIHRMSRSQALEAVFPFWVHGAIRADLSRRLGVDLLDVPDSRINAWFTDRGIAPQFVYNWDDLGGDPGTVVAYPAAVKFLLYSAGTWVRGTSDIITIDTLYDSVKLGQNDYTALFTEEGWLTAKRGHDSRVVTVPISADGATHGGVLIGHNGAIEPAA